MSTEYPHSQSAVTSAVNRRKRQRVMTRALTIEASDKARDRRLLCLSTFASPLELLRQAMAMEPNPWPMRQSRTVIQILQSCFGDRSSSKSLSPRQKDRFNRKGTRSCGSPKEQQIRRKPRCRSVSQFGNWQEGVRTGQG